MYETYRASFDRLLELAAQLPIDPQRFDRAGRRSERLALTRPARQESQRP